MVFLLEGFIDARTRSIVTMNTRQLTCDIVSALIREA